MIDMRNRLLLALGASSALALGACAEDTVVGDTQEGCVATDDGYTCSGEITESLTWAQGTVVQLTDLVFVTGGTLTIEQGVTVLGDSGSALIITRNAQIDAVGTSAQPIVFTSSKAEADRRRGDWGGLVLLGEAPINVDAGQIEGIEADDARGSYGGNDPAHDCGTVNYVRIEYAGFEIGADNELNGLTLGGCGSQTDLDYIQVHMGLDDGIEFFGGTADISHAVISRPGDDALDWDEGWSGRAQFVFIQLDASAENGFESDNLESNNDATPRSNPTIYNVTMVGSDDPDASNRGMLLRRGTGGVIANTIISGFRNEAIDIRDEATVSNLEDGTLNVDYLYIYDIGEDGSSWFSDESGVDDEGEPKDDDGGFIEEDHFLDEVLTIEYLDPELEDAQNLADPDPRLGATSPAATGGATPPGGGFFDTSATYYGAFDPAAASWMTGWTDFP
jgi:hypothetical protein